jgi:hypothetical protein
MPKHKLLAELEDAIPGTPHELPQAPPDSDLFADPADYSAVGGPDNEPAYGRTRAIDGEYPFNIYGGPYDRDERSDVPRGGILTHHRVAKRT